MTEQDNYDDEVIKLNYYVLFLDELIYYFFMSYTLMFISNILFIKKALFHHFIFKLAMMSFY